MHFHSCTITPVDNIPDLLRESGTFLLHPRELQRADNMKPKSLPLRLSDRNPPAAETLNAGTAKYQRHVDCADHQESVHHSGHTDSRTAVDSSRQKNEKSHREIHFAFLPERYEPLMDEAQAKAKEEKKKRKKEQYKKVRKNVGKALRATWKCLMLGLYNFALGYSTPITVAATFVPDFHPGRNTS